MSSSPNKEDNQFAKKNSGDVECSKKNSVGECKGESLEAANAPEASNENTVLEMVDITSDESGGVMKQIVQAGEGDDCPGYGDNVCVHYTGWLLNNSEKPEMFDSNRKEKACEFQLGKGNVIKGWDLGISTMKRNEVALFIIQPHYAYGEMGYPPKIPAHTPLLFEVELLGWKLEDISPRKDGSVLRKIVRRGEGTTTPNEGSQVKIKLEKLIDDSVYEDVEKDFILGEGCDVDLLETLETALLRFHLKEQSILYISSRHALSKNLECSESGTDPEVKYKITLLNFEKAKDVWEMNSDEKLQRAEICKEKGTTFIKSGHIRAAVKQFKVIVSCLENEPGVTSGSEKERQSILLSAYLNLSFCFLKLQNYKDVIKFCDKALDHEPDNEKALYRRGQARMKMNDFEDSLQDFQTLCSIYPSNKAAKNSIVFCQENMKKQVVKDKSIYNNMFDKFKKQDEERLKSMKTETGVWEDENSVDNKIGYMTEAERIMEQNNSELRDIDIIELSNTAS